MGDMNSYRRMQPPLCCLHGGNCGLSEGCANPNCKQNRTFLPQLLESSEKSTFNIQKSSPVPYWSSPPQIRGKMESAAILAAVFAGFLVGSIGAQPSNSSSAGGDGGQYPYTTFTPSMGVIIVVLVATIFLMGFFSVYVRHCSDGSVSVGSIRRGLSMRARRHAAARGLDAEIVEAFPTFSYSEVKDHKIGKGALECAVCLNEFGEDDTLRLLPKCDHVFHPECIGAWLEHHVTCPVCRANLQQPHAPPPVPNAGGESNDADDRSVSRRPAEIVIPVDELPTPVPEIPPSETPPPPPQPKTPRSVRRQKTIVGFAKFKSHSTGHSLVLPGENLDRFTLRLPEGVRKDVIDRATLNRTTSSYAGGGGGSSRGGGEGSSRGGSHHREAKPDRWAIFGRALSGKLTRVTVDGAGAGGSVGGGRAPMRMRSFNCLEPVTEDGAGLIRNDAARNPV